MNLMGFDADTFGNHNFDRGTEHLQRMVDLAEFSYVSSNLRNVEAELDGVAPYRIFHLGKTPVAVIGITNPERRRPWSSPADSARSRSPIPWPQPSALVRKRARRARRCSWSSPTWG
jgi:hypothetical protein